jgi:hypothetical protein
MWINEPWGEKIGWVQKHNGEVPNLKYGNLKSMQGFIVCKCGHR